MNQPSMNPCSKCGSPAEWRYSFWAEVWCTNGNCNQAEAVALDDYPTDEEAVTAVIEKWNKIHEPKHLQST